MLHLFPNCIAVRFDYHASTHGRLLGQVSLYYKVVIPLTVVVSSYTTIDDAIDAAGLPLLGVIPEDPDVPYCLNRGLVLREQNYYAARAYENIAKRIMGQKTPLMKI